MVKIQNINLNNKYSIQFLSYTLEILEPVYHFEYFYCVILNNSTYKNIMIKIKAKYTNIKLKIKKIEYSII